MGIFHIGCHIENHKDEKKHLKINGLLVDTGAAHTWIREDRLKKIDIVPLKKDVPFRMANGQLITRNLGFMIIRVNHEIYYR